MNVAELVAELERSDDDATVEIAAEALAEGRGSAPELIALLTHEAASVRRAAALALGQRGEARALAPLLERLRDANGLVRAAACQAVSRLGDPSAAAALIPLLADRLQRVRAVAAESLGGFPSSEALAALEERLGLERAEGPRRAALTALARLGEAEGLRSAALTALARHAGREAHAELSGLAAERLIGLAGEASYGELLPLLRAVPASGRASLADALEGAGVQGPLLRLAGELRSLPPDAGILSRFGSDLSQRAREGRLGRAWRRERELQAIRSRLARPGPRGLVLVGPSGVGKTALIHELARRLAEEPVLVPTTVYEVTTGEVLSGTRFLGEWQTRLKELQEALQSPHRAVWYLPDINRLVDAGTTVNSDESFATMLAPALERGDLIILGESTPEAYRRGLDRFPAFSKLFWRLNLEEPDEATTRGILADVAQELVAQQARRGRELEIPAPTLDRLQELAQDYLANQARPGSGVTLLREAAAAALQEEEDRSGGERPAKVTLHPSRVLATLSHLTGVPIRLLDDTIPLDLDEVRRFFADRVLGQDEAVEAVVDLIGLVKAGLSDPSRPLGLFFFVGPTGVGKTEMAKAVAEFIFGSPDRLVRVDLGEFKEPDAHRRLVGDPQALDPAARSGLLTAPVRERPFSVVLLDEVEKAHRNVFDLLLPLLAEGRLIDEQGRVTDFRRSIVIMTSNLGSDLREDAGLGFAGEAEDEARVRDKVQRVMEEVFRPEFLNRIGRTIVFAPLSQEVMRRLTRREARRVLKRRGITRRNVVVELDDPVIGLLLQEGFSARWGARPLKRRVEDLLLKPLARALLDLGRAEDGSSQAIVRLRVEQERIVSRVTREHEEPEEEAAEAARAPTARIRDARRGRLVALDDLAGRVTELEARLKGIAELLEAQGLRERKRALLASSSAPDFWDDRERASATLSEIAQLERTLELPGRLGGRLERLRQLVERADGRPGETRVLHDLLARSDEAAQEVELADWAVRCQAPEERGDAWIVLRRVGEGAFPVDPVERLAGSYLAWAEAKGFTARAVYEAPARRGLLREVGLHVSGPCAYGLLRGEGGLHQWVQRPEARRRKQVAFARVEVLPGTSEPLRPSELLRERRPLRDEPGVIVNKPRQHLVLIHQPTLVALDGNADAGEEVEEAALGLLAARVRQASAPEPDVGVVRRFDLDHELVRDFGSGVKLALGRVLAGELDAFVLPRLSTPAPGDAPRTT